MNYNYIKCGDSLELMEELEDGSINIILTSPPYNTSRNINSARALNKHETRYDTYEEKENDVYIEWIIKFYNTFDRILAKNGVILWNVSYGSENLDILWNTISQIITRTNFSVADCIVWKKNSALPNNTSKNKLTRICEFVFVLCRKNEIKTFNTNKQVKSVSTTGQKYYHNYYNFIEAPNNDGSCTLNKATFSTSLVRQLLTLYSSNEDDIVLDCFIGTGTTAVACKQMNKRYIGYELSEKQYQYALNRIENSEVL